MKIFASIILTVLVVCASPAFAGELEVGGTYRLGITVTDLKAVGGDETKYTAKKNSKFFVISKDESGDYIVRFDRIYSSEPEAGTDTKDVSYDNAYILAPKVNGMIPVDAISRPSMAGLSSGPLVVPFKYRLDNDSLSGDATIGFYAGITFEPGCLTESWCFRITPLLSAGLSQVSVVEANGTGTENKTSATWATGFLITDWSNMNIGLIYGQDRIGDKTWEHEGEGWLSFMIGWQL